MAQKVPNDSTKLAGRTVEGEDYQKKDQLSSGLATTHEQAHDAYTEGEIGAVIEAVDGEDVQLGKTE